MQSPKHSATAGERLMRVNFGPVQSDVDQKLYEVKTLLAKVYDIGNEEIEKDDRRLKFKLEREKLIHTAQSRLLEAEMLMTRALTLLGE